MASLHKVFYMWPKLFISTWTLCLQVFLCYPLLSLHYQGLFKVYSWGGHLDLAPRQSLCKDFKILKIYSCRDAESSLSVWSVQHWPLMKSLHYRTFLVTLSEYFLNMCPIHLHLCCPIDIWMASWLAHFQRSSFVIPLNLKMLMNIS